MRGKHGEPHERGQGGRIIPAHAGQTLEGARKRVETADHPRACGANPAATLFASPATGSSPRMRGKHTCGAVVIVNVRIIPAHAGQTAARVRTSHPHKDHPRACGANEAGHRLDSDRQGSSPRMRGKRHRLGVGTLRSRIIPAHAGQTPALNGIMWSSSDHPRACGANNREAAYSGL